MSEFDVIVVGTVYDNLHFPDGEHSESKGPVCAVSHATSVAK